MVVLILVLVEDSLGVYDTTDRELRTFVLILVLVEDSLGAQDPSDFQYMEVQCLNPCFSGR